MLLQTAKNNCIKRRWWSVGLWPLRLKATELPLRFLLSRKLSPVSLQVGSCSGAGCAVVSHGLLTK